MYAMHANITNQVTTGGDAANTWQLNVTVPPSVVIQLCGLLRNLGSASRRSMIVEWISFNNNWYYSKTQVFIDLAISTKCIHSPDKFVSYQLIFN